MKPIGFFIVAVLLVAHSSQAQVSIGLLGGLHFSQADQSRFYNANAAFRTNYALGGLVEYAFTENLSLLAEPTYLEKGTSAQPIALQGMAPRIHFDLSYVEFPLFLKYSVGHELRPYILFGPAVGINLSSRLRGELAVPGLGQLEIEASADGIVKEVEYSLEVGGGLSYQIDGIVSLFFEARYSHGLNNIVRNGSITVGFLDDISEVQPLNDPIYRNKGFTIMAGFCFPLQISE